MFGATASQTGPPLSLFQASIFIFTANITRARAAKWATSPPSRTRLRALFTPCRPRAKRSKGGRGENRNPSRDGEYRRLHSRCPAAERGGDRAADGDRLRLGSRRFARRGSHQNLPSESPAPVRSAHYPFAGAYLGGKGRCH